jgi:tetratricopeptide (TPR) repeat protein
VRRAAVGVLAASLALGCGPKSDKAFTSRMAAAEAARSDVDEAVRRYDEAAREATRAGDSLRAMEAAATLLERSARMGEAEARWSAIAADARATEADKGTASLRLARIRARDEASRLAAELAWLRAHPAHPAAPKVLRERFAELDDAARAVLADDLLASPTMAPLAPWLRMEKARVAARAGRALEAIDAMEKLAKDDPYPRGVLFDDALDEASLLALASGDRGRALRILELAFGEHEHAWVVGSANRPRFPALFLRRARLQPTDEAARVAYRAMLEAVPESREAGEARYELGLLEATLGKPEAACALGRELEARDAKRLVARCARVFCATLGTEPAAPELCATLGQRREDDLRGVPRAGLDR